MSPKRPRSRKRKNVNKKCCASFNLDNYLADFDFLVGDDQEYCHCELSYFKSFQQDDNNNFLSEYVHFSTVVFEMINFQELNNSEQQTSCLFANSNNGLYLLLSNDDTRLCNVVTTKPIQPEGHGWTYETSSWLFKAMKNAKTTKTLTVETQIKKMDDSHVLELNFFLSKKVIIQDYESLCKNFLQKNDTILKLMYFFYKYESNTKDFDDRASSPTASIDEFYSMVYAKQVENSVFDSIPLPKLDSLVPLRAYQESAVKWMLHREKDSKVNDHQIVFVKEKLANKDLYYNPHLGYFITEKVFAEYMANLKSSLGGISGSGISGSGICGDEMGLGKTVEILALIMHNRKDNVQAKYSFFNRSQLFSLSSNPLFGTIQCSCGKEGTSVIENTSVEYLLERCLQQKYCLNENLIKCLLCGNYQHIECSRYQIGEDDFPYLCSRCWIKVDPVDSGCTLIVCPKSILKQWEVEISKHLTNVKVYIYNGVRSKEYPFAANLAKYDIVITTYDVLRSEVDFSSPITYEHLRGSRRYYSPVSPLLCVHWHRLAFDEAQLVEGYSRATQMANSLSATYRWAVTGTPIQQSVNDLHGLLSFIGEDPFCHKPIWNSALYNPFCKGKTEPLINAIVNCFWRTPKSAVIKELNILQPIYLLKRLEFSQIERDFYQRQADKCKESIDLHFEGVDRHVKLGDLSHTSRLIALTLALKLRQTCCHPRICFGSSTLNSAKKFKSLEDVLEKMIEDIKYESEKSHREKIAGMNGKAGILLLKNDFKGAFDTYKAALCSILKYEEYFRTDKTQQFHIYYNLAEIAELFDCPQVDNNNEHFRAFMPLNELQSTTLNFNFESVDKSSLALTEEDKLLRVKAKQLYDEYLLNDKLACITTDKYRLELVSNCNDIEQSYEFKGKWFIAALTSLSGVLDIEEIDAFLSQSLATNHSSEATSKPTLNSIKCMLNTKFEHIESARKEMVDTFTNLLDVILALTKVDQFIRCHVKKIKSTPKCILCLAEKAIKKYEKNLFNIQVKIIEDEENAANNQTIETGNWNESTTVLALRRLGQLYKSRSGSFADHEPMVKEIDRFVKYLDEIKKEFKAHRKLFTNLCDFVLRIDELNQAQTRIIVPTSKLQLTIEGMQAEYNATLERTIATLDLDRANGEKNLGCHLDRLKYLVNLKISLKDKNNVESRVCSICWNDLDRYYVLVCGHMFCVVCVARLDRHSHTFNVDQGNLRCSVCRQVSKKDSLCCITSSQEQSKVEVLGSWSTKIVHITRCVMSILESNEKILIFSSWTVMLHIMKEALTANDINSFLVTSSERRFVDRIQTFKTSPTENVLLLPINFACNGLNLTEASHIIFINSSLNKADELQAIGRIYRFGQTKQTYVHKFIIDSSIEELVENHNEHVFHKQKGAYNEYDKMTVRQYLTLFDY